MTKVVEGGALEGEDFVTDSGQEKKKFFFFSCFSSFSDAEATSKSKELPIDCNCFPDKVWRDAQ